MVCCDPLTPVLGSDWVPQYSEEEKEFQDYKETTTRHFRQLIRREKLAVTFKLQ